MRSWLPRVVVLACGAALVVVVGGGPASAASSYQLLAVDAGTISGSVPANGLLAYVTVDTHGFGFFPITLSPSELGPTTLYSDDQVSLVDNYVVVAPEPTAWLLMAMAAVALAMPGAARRIRGSQARG